jgi:hypothetical protein
MIIQISPAMPKCHAIAKRLFNCLTSFDKKAKKKLIIFFVDVTQQFSMEQQQLWEESLQSNRHESQKPLLPYNNLSQVIIDWEEGETSARHQLEADDNGTQRKGLPIEVEMAEKRQQ